MIECKRCRDLIDADLAGSLGAKDRTPMAVHLRTCHDCVGYKARRLQDSSILRRPVAELKEVPTPEPPPPPPRRPSPLPWILTAGGLILAMAAGIALLRDDGDEETADPDKRRKPVAHTATDPETKPPESTTPPEGDEPAASTQVKPKWPIIAVLTAGQPTPAAWLAVASGAQPNADSERRRANAAGLVELREPLRYPVFVTAWTADRISPTARIDEPSGVALHLGPADSIAGTLALESDGAVRGVVATWAGGGRSIGLVDSDGRFRIAVPSPRPQLELRTWADDDITFALAPGPLALSPSIDSDVSLLAVRAHRLTVRMTPQGPIPQHAVATANSGRTFTLTAATRTDGGPAEAVTALLPPGDYSIEIVRPGFERFERTLPITGPTAFEASFEPSLFSASGLITLTPGAELIGDVVIRPVPSPTARSSPPRAPWSTTWSTERWWPPWQIGITAPIAADGSFSAKGLPWDQVIIEAGDDARFAFGPFSLPAESLRLDLRADATVFGTVRDAAARPVPGIEVNLESTGLTRRILTNADGYYEFAGVVVGPTTAYPRAIVGEFASGRESRSSYEFVTTAGGKHQRDFNLPGVTAADIAIMDPQGNAFASSIVVNTVDGREVATVAPGPSPNRPFRLPPLTAGTYLAHMIENDVVYPLGKLTLPGRLERVLRRDGPQLEVTCAWGESTPRARAALLIVQRDGQVLSQFVVGIGGAHRIGGLPTGRYNLELRYGAHRAFGVADLADGRPVAPLTLTIR